MLQCFPVGKETFQILRVFELSFLQQMPTILRSPERRLLSLLRQVSPMTRT